MPAAPLRDVERQLPEVPAIVFNDPHPIRETMLDTGAIAYTTLPPAPDKARIIEAPVTLWEN